MNATDAIGCFSSADALFGPVVQGCRHDFDFTLSFEQYFLSIAPAALLVVAAPLRISYLHKFPNVVQGRSLRTAKTTAITLFASVQLSLIALWATQPTGSLRATSIASSSLSFLASLVLCVLSFIEHVKSVKPSFILNGYLFLSIVFDGAILRTLWLADAPPAIRAIFTTSFALKATILVLEAREKNRYIIRNGQQRSPEETSGLYSQGLYWWLNSLLVGGFRQLLKPSDLFPIEPVMSAAVLNEKFWVKWNQAINHGKYKLLTVCINTLKWPIAASIFPRVALLAFTICQPLLLNRFLTYLERPSDSVSVGYSIIAAYGLVYVGMAISSGFYWHRAYRMATMLRGILVSAVFQKTAEISITATDNSAAVTLMSTDVEATVQAVMYVHEVWADMIQIGIATYLLTTQIGAAAAGPALVCILSLGATLFVAPKARGSQGKWFEQVQKRVGTTSTILGHMKNIKMSGLAGKMSETIAQMRVDETVAAKPFRMIMAATASLAQVPLLLSPVAAFAIFSITALQTGETLEATRLFSSLSLIILLAQPLFSTFEVILDLLAALACFDRIQKFLVTETRHDYRNFIPSSPRLEETPGSRPGGFVERAGLSLGEGIEMTEMSKPTHHTRPRVSGKIIVELQDASFAWSSEAPPVVKNATMDISTGQFVLIVGPVAAGKSTLLKGVLGEVPVATGSVTIAQSRVSWCDQAPWLTNQSVRKNILGFNHFDADLYQSVVYACDLQKDFVQFPDGDETLVGSKGISLSGGQRQRVSLARAIYSRPEIAVFDDVLSGLDNCTLKTVCNRVFSENEGILRKWGTTVLLATQTATVLPLADHVISLGSDGSIVEQGSFDTLLNNDGYVSTIHVQENHSKDGDAIQQVAPEDAVREIAVRSSAHDETGVLDKRRQLGDFTVYRYYFASLGVVFTTAIFTMEVCNAFFSTFPTVWLKWWSDASAAEGNQSVGYYLGVYAAFQVAALITFSALTWFLFVKMVAKSGIELHHKLLNAVVRAPLSVFTSTDTGSITTRFSQDLGHLDRDLPLGMLVTIGSFLTCIVQAVLMASATFYIALSFPVLIGVFYLLQNAFLRTSRQLRFLDLEEKAPVYTQFLETLSGLSTIRAFGWSAPAVAQNHALVDRSQRPFYLLLMIQRWLTLVLDLIVAALALLVVGVAVRLRDSVSVALTGVSLVQLVTFAETVRVLIQWWTSLETSIGAVARIRRFCEDTPDEEAGDGEPQGEVEQVLPAGWPARGGVELGGISACYGDDEGGPRALEDVSLSIRPGEKVGIVGRTGSGKSTLLLALSRMLPLARGRITIDGVDIVTVPLSELRSRLVVVTQDQFFLPGSVRANVDPWSSSSSPPTTASASANTPAIADVLRRVGLWDAVQRGGGLDVAFDEGVFSHGQRQLFSLARALLQSRGGGSSGDGSGGGKVVLMDEATSSVDHHTEARMQELIRDEFGQHTVIAIAHRLDMIADFDRVVVLEKGFVVEQGRPDELLRRRGAFRELWDAARRAAR